MENPARKEKIIFAKRVKSLREQKKWTQDYLAKKMGVSRSTIAGYESVEKIRTAKGKNLVRLSDVLGTTTDYLLGKTDDPETDPNDFDLKAIKEALGKDDTELLWGGKPLPSEDQEYLKRVLEPIIERIIKAEEENS